jgi:hypothetical protein
MFVEATIERALRKAGLLEGSVFGGEADSNRSASVAEELARAVRGAHKRWRWAPLIVAILYVAIFSFGMLIAYRNRADVSVVLAVGSGLLFASTLGLRSLWREVVLAEILGAVLPSLPPEEALRVAYETYRYARASGNKADVPNRKGSK